MYNKKGPGETQALNFCAMFMQQDVYVCVRDGGSKFCDHHGLPYVYESRAFFYVFVHLVDMLLT